MLHVIDRTLHIGNVSAPDLIERYGSPLYVYDAEVIRRQTDRVRQAFSALPFRPFYAMKANGALAILDLVRGAGFGCDAVSPGEIFIARQAGFTPDNIWFTCSNVSDDDLRAIPDERIVSNVNSMSEIDRILALSTDFANLRWINFGGGISVPYEPGAKEFPIDDYGAELTRIADRLLRARDLDAILEPGRYLVAESGTLLSRVTSRRISGGQWWIGVDTGFNHLVRPSKYGAYHHIVTATNGSPASLREGCYAAQMHDAVVIA